MMHRTNLLPAFLALASIVSAQDIQKEKFSLGSWENDIGYAQAVRVGDTLHISGSVGAGAMPDAIRQAFGALKETLAHYSLDFRHVVKETIYTTDIEALKAAQNVRKTYYGTDFPAATWVQVSRLYEPDHVIEVELTAIFPASTTPAVTKISATAGASANSTPTTAVPAPTVQSQSPTTVPQ